MNFWEKVKGVFRRMISSQTIESALSIQPAISTPMKDAIELWENMYMNKSPWLNDDVRPLGLPALIASEKARTATIELEVKVTGESEEAKIIKTSFDKLLSDIEVNLEYGIALGELIIKPYIYTKADGSYDFGFNYVKATDFYPLSFSSDGNITECAFVDRIIVKDTVYSKLEYHKLEGNKLTVRNLAYKSENSTIRSNGAIGKELGTPIALAEVPEWANLQEETVLGPVDTMLFAYFKMPEANTIDLDSPLGVSGFSKAVDLIQDADEQYADLMWEFEGGQLALDVDRTAFNPTIDSKGNPKSVLPKLQDRLYRRSLDLGTDDTYNIFSPALRDASILNGLNSILMRIEDACALSRGTLSEYSYAEARTATELRILKQRTYSANAHIQKNLQNAFENIVDILDIYCKLYNIVPAGTYQISYSWDDSIIVDKDTERQVDLLDVDKGIMSKVQYRVKWYGETKEQAEAEIKEIQDQAMENMQKQLDITNTSTPSNANGQSTSDAEASQNKLQRSNESNKVTTN